MSTLWQGRFEGGPADELLAFTVSLPVDRRLAVDDLAGSRAHVRGLARAGILTDDEAAVVLAALDRVGDELVSGRFTFEPTDEDIHTAIERRVTALAGAAGAKLHTGRSRNDQVALDLHLFVRDAAENIRDALLEAMRALVELAERHRVLILPGYTHLQRAQPILLSHHLLAHFWAFERDLERLDAAREAANVSPLGAAALAGTPHPVDPALTAEALGMRPLVSERDFALDLLYACAVLGVHLSRLGEEWVLWTSSEFGFATLDDAYSSGSSIMPQKKNPDAYELMRGKAGRLVGNLNALFVTLKGLPLGYSKDLQEDKEPLFDSVDSVLGVLAVLPEMLRTASFDCYRMQEAAGGFALATELADYLAARGVPFREAHRAVGQLVRRCEEEGISLEDVSDEELTAAHPALADLPRDLLTPEGSVANKKSSGSTSRESVEGQIQRAREMLNSSEKA
jgi:argininosuccinate lyase